MGIKRVMIDAVELGIASSLMYGGIQLGNIYMTGATYLLIGLLCVNIGCDYNEYKRKKSIEKTVSKTAETD